MHLKQIFTILLISYSANIIKASDSSNELDTSLQSSYEQLENAKNQAHAWSRWHQYLFFKTLPEESKAIVQQATIDQMNQIDENSIGQFIYTNIFQNSLIGMRLSEMFFGQSDASYYGSLYFSGKDNGHDIAAREIEFPTDDHVKRFIQTNGALLILYKKGCIPCSRLLGALDQHHIENQESELTELCRLNWDKHRDKASNLPSIPDIDGTPAIFISHNGKLQQVLTNQPISELIQTLSNPQACLNLSQTMS